MRNLLRYAVVNILLLYHRTSHRTSHETSHETSLSLARKTWEMDDEGYTTLPEGPGLGVEIDEEKAIEHGKNPANAFKWPDYRLRDGSVSDY